MIFNKIYQKDSLFFLKVLESSMIDFVYIDPPFFTQRKFEDRAGEFSDKWDSLEEYLDFLKLRFKEIHRVLSDKGVFCLHLDYRAVHYAKVELDKIFGYKNLINEIIWKRAKGLINTCTAKFATVTDTILIYSKNQNKAKFNKLYTPITEKQRKGFNKIDEKGRFYKFENLHPPKKGKQYFTYKGYKPHWNGWPWTLEKMKEMDEKGYLYFPKNKDQKIKYKVFLDENKGRPINNLWDDVSALNSTDSERENYPTQKPLRLLNRLIETFTDRGDLVADFFCGSGTTLVSAEGLERNWLGCDKSEVAVKIAEKRIRKTIKQANLSLDV